MNMDQKVDSFISNWTGKPVDTDGVYPNQCMDLAHEYVKDVLGLPITLLAHPSAYQVFTDFTESQYFDKIANTPTGVPQKGDLVVFGQAIGANGHICIFIEGDVSSFNSFDANWPTGSLPHVQTHNYNGVLGWLHPKNVPPTVTQVQVDSDTFEQLVTKSTKFDAFVAGGYNSIDDVLKALADKESTIQNQAKDLQTCQTNLKQAQDLSTKLNDEDLSTSDQLLDAQHALQPYKDTVASFQQVLGLSSEATTSDIVQAIKDLKASKIKPAKPMTTKLGILFTKIANYFG